jgi:hypothetical protein
MTWMATAIIGSSIIGAGASMYGANKQAKAADQASQVQWDMYDRTRSDLQPWMGGGTAALNQLQTMLGLNQGQDPMQSQFLSPFTLDKFQQSPGYQFRLEQGMNAINKGSAARGMYYAPQTLQDLGKYQQGMASTEFDNAYNRYVGDQTRGYNMLSGLSNTGQNAAAGVGAMGQQTASQVGNNMMGGAAAQAAGYMGAANAIGGGLQGLGNYSMYLSQLQQPAYGGSIGGYGRAGDNLRPIG